MPPIEGKIRLCSNLMREPQVFDQLGDLAGGIARDLLIWAAWNNAQHVILHLPQFCKMMGYHRRHLLRKFEKEHPHVQELVKRGVHVDDVGILSNPIGYTLGVMATQMLLFAEERKPLEPAKYRKASRRYTNKKMLSGVDIDKRSTGTIIKFDVDAEVIENCRERYQTIRLDEYLSLKTPGGHPDDQARKMYLRLVWKRQYWDSQHVEAGVYPTKDSYRELLAVAGLEGYGKKSGNIKRQASELRALLERIGALESVNMIPTVQMDYSKGVYEVTWKRRMKDGAKTSKRGRPRKTDTVAEAE